MRTLKFIVDNQIIMRDPNCDFDDLVPGTEGYLQASFLFSPDWSGCIKVASFFSALGVEYEPQALKDGETCMIPADALKKRVFKVQVLGKNASGKKIVTNKATVFQKGAKR